MTSNFFGVKGKYILPHCDTCAINMKEKFAFLTVAVLVICAAVIGPVTAQNDNGDTVIYVSGNGKVTTDPDRAIISLAVETENTDVKIAQQENAQRMDRTIAALKALGLTSDDLATTGYNIYSLRDTDSGGVWDTGKPYYRVTNTLMVTLKDINRVGEVIDTAIANGANSVNYISFTLSDEKQKELRAQALEDAVLNARSDADAVAGALGLSIQGVKEVSVGGGYTPMRYDTYGYAEAAGVPTPIETDTVDVTATVSITYFVG
jgi:uncharacterized protein YggE